ncbi:MAG: hypothetical protein AAF066_02150 [Pseudomonadota bacterium]
MPEPREQDWDFGDLGEPEEKRRADRDLINKSREAAAAVGYEAPAETKTEVWSEPAQVLSKPKIGRPSKGRTVALSTKITPEHDALLKAISSEGFVIADIIDEILKNYAQTLKSTGYYKRFPLSEAALVAVQAVLDAHMSAR